MVETSHLKRKSDIKSRAGLLGKFTMDKFPLPKHRPDSLVEKLLDKYTWLTGHGWTVCLQLGLYWFIICICTSQTDEYSSLSYFPGGIKSNLGGVVGTIAVVDSMGLSIFKSIQLLVTVVIGQCLVSYPVLYLVWACNGLDWLTWSGKAAWLFVWMSTFYAVLMALRVRFAKLERVFFMFAFFGMLMVALQAYPTVKPPATSPRPVAMPVFWALVSVAVCIAMAICSLILPTTAGSWVTGYLANAIHNIGDMFQVMFNSLVFDGDAAASGLDDARTMMYTIYDDLDANGTLQADMPAVRLDFNIYNILLCQRHRNGRMPSSLHTLHVLCRAIVKTSSTIVLGVQSSRIPGFSPSKATDEAMRSFLTRRVDNIQQLGCLLTSACHALSDALVNRQPFSSALEKLCAVENHAHTLLAQGLPHDGNLSDKYIAATMHGSLRVLTNQMRCIFQASACLIEQYQAGAMDLMLQHTGRDALFKQDVPTEQPQLEAVVRVQQPTETKGTCKPSLMQKFKVAWPKSKSAPPTPNAAQPKKKPARTGHQAYEESYFGPMTGPWYKRTLERLNDGTGYDWIMLRQFLQLQLGFMVAVAIFLIPEYTTWTMRQSVLYVIYATVAFPREAGRNLSWAIIQCMIVAAGAVIGALTVLLLHAISGGTTAESTGKAALMGLIVGVMGFVVQACIQRAHLKYKMTFVFMQTNLLLVALTGFVKLDTAWRPMAFRIFNYALAWITVVLAQLVVFPITSREACRNFTGLALEGLDDLLMHVMGAAIVDVVPDVPNTADKPGDVNNNVADSAPADDAGSEDRSCSSSVTAKRQSGEHPTGYPEVIKEHREELVSLVTTLSKMTFATMPACMSRANLNLDKIIIPWNPKFEYTKCRWVLGIMHTLEERAKSVVYVMEAVGSQDIGQVSDALKESAARLRVSMSRVFRGLRYFSMAIISPERMRATYDDMYNDFGSFLKEAEASKPSQNDVQRHITAYLVSMVGSTVFLAPLLMQHLPEVFWDPNLLKSEWREELQRCLPGPVDEDVLNGAYTLIVDGYLADANGNCEL